MLHCSQKLLEGGNKKVERMAVVKLSMIDPENLSDGWDMQSIDVRRTLDYPQIQVPTNQTGVFL